MVNSAILKASFFYFQVFSRDKSCIAPLLRIGLILSKNVLDSLCIDSINTVMMRLPNFLPGLSGRFPKAAGLAARTAMFRAYTVKLRWNCLRKSSQK